MGIFPYMPYCFSDLSNIARSFCPLYTNFWVLARAGEQGRGKGSSAHFFCAVWARSKRDVGVTVCFRRKTANGAENGIWPLVNSLQLLLIFFFCHSPSSGQRGALRFLRDQSRSECSAARASTQIVVVHNEVGTLKFVSHGSPGPGPEPHSGLDTKCAPHARPRANQITSLPNWLVMDWCWSILRMQMGPESHVRFQVVTVGDSKKGKSTLLKNMFFESMECSSDVELERTTSVLLLQNRDIFKQRQWQIRDLPGEPQYWASNLNFLTADCTVFLVVCSLEDRQSNRELQVRKWLSLLASLATSGRAYRMVLVCTHQDKILAQTLEEDERWLKHRWKKWRREYPNLDKMDPINGRDRGHMQRLAVGRFYVEQKTLNRLARGGEGENSTTWCLSLPETIQLLERAVPDAKSALAELIAIGDVIYSCAVVAHPSDDKPPSDKTKGLVERKLLVKALQDKRWPRTMQPTPSANSSQLPPPKPKGQNNESSAKCKECGKDFGWLRWRYICHVCKKNFCRGCMAFDTCNDCDIEKRPCLVPKDIKTAEVSCKDAFDFLQDLGILPQLGSHVLITCRLQKKYLCRKNPTRMIATRMKANYLADGLQFEFGTCGSLAPFPPGFMSILQCQLVEHAQKLNSSGGWDLSKHEFEWCVQGAEAEGTVRVALQKAEIHLHMALMGTTQFLDRHFQWVLSAVRRTMKRFG
eukprot:g14029.t1